MAGAGGGGGVVRGGSALWWAALALLTLFLLSAGSSAAASAQQWSKPDYSYYHTGAGIIEAVKALADRHPDVMQLSFEERTDDHGSYTARVAVATLNNNNNSRLRALLSFGQHGRELITAEVGLRLLEVLTGEKSIAGNGPPTPDEVERVRQIMDAFTLKILPLENENGRKLVDSGKLCERKNGRGVDLNRNWAVDWGKKEKDYDPSEEYPGTGPFSEPEAVIVRGVARAFRPHLWAAVHSGMEAMFIPYDHVASPVGGPVGAAMAGVAETVSVRHCRKCALGSGGKSVGYLAHGTTTDYMYESMKVPYAYTFEIFGDTDANSNDCFRMFNPTTKPLLEQTVANWTAAFLTLLQLLAASNPTTAAEQKEASSTHSTPHEHAPDSTSDGMPSIRPLAQPLQPSSNNLFSIGGRRGGAMASGYSHDSSNEGIGGAYVGWHAGVGALVVGLLVCGVVVWRLHGRQIGIHVKFWWKRTLRRNSLGALIRTDRPDLDEID
eukprot:jgi/Chlat1/3320/Chrsp22S03474